MSKDKISDYSQTANSNTDIGGINVDEGCAPSGINDAIRTLMKQLKDFQQGTNSDSFNGPVNGTIGATTPAAGAFTTLSASSTLSVTGDGTIQGLTVGKGAGAVSTNTAVGASALAANTSGGGNSAYGDSALYSNTTGAQNAAFSGDSLGANTTGSYNCAFGKQALRYNTTASNNTAVGYQAGYSNTTGQIDAFGNWALKANTTGNYSVAFGNQSLTANTTGNDNSALGFGALYSNTTGSSNTALGRAALLSNTTASNNTAVGYQAGYSNTTGSYNVNLGYQAGYSSQTVNNNVFIGSQAGYASTGGTNICIGQKSGFALTTGTANTFVGSGVSGFLDGAGSAMTTGSKNTILGSYSGNNGGLDIRTASNYIVLSDGDGNPRGYHNGSFWYLNSSASGGYNTASNATLGIFGFTNDAAVNNSAVYNIEWKMSGDANGQFWYANYIARGGSRTLGAYCTGTSWTNSSDIANKEDINNTQYGLETVMASNPVDFRWKTMRDENGLGKKDIGFIAQEMELLVPEVVTGSDGQKGIAYGNLVAIAFKAIQELNAKVDAQAAEIAALKGQA